MALDAVVTMLPASTVTTAVHRSSLSPCSPSYVAVFSNDSAFSESRVTAMFPCQSFQCQATQARALRTLCQATDKDKVTEMRQVQLHTTEVLAELLKAEDKEKAAEKYVEFLTEDFFMVASTYMELAKKEGNLQFQNQIETTLKTAMSAKEKTLRPEIRLLNQLMRDEGPSDRVDTMKKYAEYLMPGSYFFSLLNRMQLDVELQKSNPKRLKLLTQLRVIGRESKEASKAIAKRMSESANSHKNAQ